MRPAGTHSHRQPCAHHAQHSLLPNYPCPNTYPWLVGTRAHAHPRTNPSCKTKKAPHMAGRQERERPACAWPAVKNESRPPLGQRLNGSKGPLAPGRGCPAGPRACSGARTRSRCRSAARCPHSEQAGTAPAGAGTSNSTGVSCVVRALQRAVGSHAHGSSSARERSARLQGSRGWA